MLRHVLGIALVPAFAISLTSAQAQTKGGLDCPSGKVEAKSFAAYYVPSKSALTIFFYKDALTDEELDAQMADRSRFDAGDNAKGPGAGTGKSAPYKPYIFKAWTRVSAKPGATVNAADFTKSAYYSYVCESGKERTVNHDFKERAAKVKEHFQSVSVELKQGGKLQLASKGSYAGDPKDKNAIKVAWDVNGTGKVRVYE